ncbi:hypothetical protein ACLMJK_004539 [Lecanora helva]
MLTFSSAVSPISYSPLLNTTNSRSIDDTDLSIPASVEGSPFMLNGKYGAEKIPITSVLMNALSGLADLAHLDHDRHIDAFHVPNLPDYTDVDIHLQPVAPDTDFEVQHATLGIYFVIYNMITKHTFRNCTFTLDYKDISLLQVTINKRPKPKYGLDANAQNSSSSIPTSSPNSPTALSDKPGPIPHFEFVPGPEEALVPQAVFIAMMATIKSVSTFPSTDIVQPFRAGALGFNVRFQCMRMEKPRTEPPFLLYGHLVDVVRGIPGYMLRERKWQGMMIVVTWGREEIIGEGVVDKGGLELGGLGFDGTEGNVSVA